MSRARDRADGKITGTVVPTANEQYSLGSSSARFNDAYFAASTVDVGGLKISSDSSGNVEFKNAAGAYKKIMAEEIHLGTGSSKAVMKRDSSSGAVSFATTDNSGNSTAASVGSSTTVVSSSANLPTSPDDGDLAFAVDTSRLYLARSSAWYSVALVNTAPSVSGNSATYELATDGTATVVTMTGTDPEGDPITWSHTASGLGSIATISRTNNVFTITPSTSQSNAGTFSVSFVANDGANTANASSSFTLAFSAPLHRGTQLLVKTSGNNNRTNQAFNDSSTGNLTVTANGDVHQSSFSPFSANWSNYFDGTGDYISSAVSSDYSIGTGDDWTVECWIHYEAGQKGIYHSHTSAFPGSNQGHALGINSSDQLTMYGNGTTTTIATPTLKKNEWTHIAVSRASGSKKVFINGVLAETVSETNAYTGTYMTIGGNWSTSYLFQGYISDFHFIKGTAKYTSAFSPPTSSTALHSNTKLLTCRSNRFMDESSSPHAITMAGDATISTFSPFIVPDKWESADGGSAYLDGSGDYLSIASTADLTFGTGEFTISFWLNLVSQSTTYASILDWRHSAPNDAAAISLTYVSSKLYVYNAGYLINNIPRNMNQWQHIVFQRRNISGTMTNEFFINGVSIHSGANTTNWTASTLKIGSSTWSDHGNFYISDLKINKGNAAYSGAFTPPTSPQALDSSTVLKLNFEQPGIFDLARNSSLKLVGNTKESTTQKKYATTSFYLDGSGDYVNIPSVTPPRTDDFQLEGWFYETSSGDNGLFQAFAPLSNSTAGVAIGTVGATMWYQQAGSQANIGSHWGQNAWKHLAVVRRNGRQQLFVDGARIDDRANTTDLTDGQINIGGYYGTNNLTSGYFEDFRYLKGHTTYPFERPQVALTAVSGTSLQFANASSIPSSPNGLTLTVEAGTPVVSSFSPPESPVNYSIYYNGSSAHKFAANTALNLGTGDFTVEGWFWVDGVFSTYGNLFDTRDGNGGGNDNGAFGLAVKTDKTYIWSGAEVVGNFPSVLYKWTHLVYQRKTISGTSTHQFFRDGILVGSTTTARTYDNHPLFLGKSHYADWSRFYVSDFRVVKGTALYNDSFTVPSAALV